MDYWHKAFACPFYVWNDKCRVGCEGKCSIGFPDKEAAREYMDKHCASIDGWHKCTIAAARERYYERKDKEDARLR